MRERERGGERGPEIVAFDTLTGRIPTLVLKTSYHHVIVCPFPFLVRAPLASPFTTTFIHFWSGFIHDFGLVGYYLSIADGIRGDLYESRGDDT